MLLNIEFLIQKSEDTYNLGFLQTDFYIMNLNGYACLTCKQVQVKAMHLFWHFIFN